MASPLASLPVKADAAALRDQELAKLKAQNTLLKKAVKQEKARSTDLETQNRYYEQELRRNAEDHDMLTFNNDRLTKRVDVLVAQLEEATKSPAGGGGWFGWGAAAAPDPSLEKEMSVLREDLDLKIEENERLHIEMFELRKQADEDMAEVTARAVASAELLREREGDVARLQVELQELREAQKAEITRLSGLLGESKEEARLRRRAIKKCLGGKDAEIAAAQSALQKANQLFATKVPIDDTVVGSANAVNVVPFDRRRASRRLELAEVGLQLFRQLTTAFNVHYTATKERLTLMNNRKPAISPAHRGYNEKLIGMTREHHKYLEAVYAALSGVRANLREHLEPKRTSGRPGPSHRPSGGEGGPAVALSRWVTFHRGMTVYWLLSLEEDPAPSSEGLSQRHSDVADALEHLAVYVELLFPAPNVPPPATHNLWTILRGASNGINATVAALDGFMNALQIKLSEESHAAFSLPSVRLTNDRILSSGAEVVNVSKQLASCVASALDAAPLPVVAVKGTDIQFAESLAQRRALTERSASFMRTIRGRKLQPQVSLEHVAKQRAQLAKLKTDVGTLQGRLDAAEETSGQLEEDREELKARLAEATQALADANFRANAAEETAYKAVAEVQQLQAKQEQMQTSSSEVGRDKTPRRPSDTASPPHEPDAEHVMPTGETTGATPPSPPVLAVQPTSLSATPMQNTSVDTLAALDALLADGRETPARDLSRRGSRTSLTSEPAVADWLLDDSPPATLARASSPTTSSDAVISQLMAAQREVARLGTAKTQGDLELRKMSEEMAALRLQLEKRGEEHQRDEAAVPSVETAECEVQTAEVEAVVLPRRYSVRVVSDGTASPDGRAIPVDKEREEAMKRYFASKLVHLQSQVTQADTRATHLLAENERAAAAITLSQGSCRQLQAALATADEKRKETMEELESTRVNYEGQIAMLTEQCIQLSDQSQRLDQERKKLKSHKVQCGRCKNWNSVNWLVTKGANGQICQKGQHPSSYNYS